MKYLIIVLCLFLFLCSCNTNSSKSDKSIDAESSLKEGSTGKVELDNSQWEFSTQQSDIGEVHFAGCLSENYYVIDGRKIALSYTFVFLPMVQLPEYRHTCTFAFRDVTDSSFTEFLPSFNTNSTNDFVTVVYSRNNSDNYPIGEIHDENIIICSPAALNLQKKLNQFKEMYVSVTTSNGRQLFYEFNINARGPLEIIP